MPTDGDDNITWMVYAAPHASNPQAPPLPLAPGQPLSGVQPLHAAFDSIEVTLAIPSRPTPYFPAPLPTPPPPPPPQPAGPSSGQATSGQVSLLLKESRKGAYSGR